MNSDLKDKYYSCPDKIIDLLASALAKYEHGGNTKGYKRAKDIIDNRRISYHQMKRMKNYFSSYKGDGTDIEYKLNGGSTMNDWINHALKNDRETIERVKSAKKEGGLKNAYLKAHEKDTNKNPMNVNIPKIKGGNKTVYENEINNIQKLIEYLNNSNKIL